MERPSKMRSKILESLSMAASPVTFQVSSPLLSPATSRKGFGSPMVSIVPKEARRQPRHSSFEQQEPTSPKVSCMGQVKNMRNKKKKMMKNTIKPKEVLHPAQGTTPVSSTEDVKKKKKKKKERVLMIKDFHGGKQCDKVDVIVDHKPEVTERVPSLGRMRKYRSSHEGASWQNLVGEYGKEDL